uniref:Superoxide dismutase [Fe] n=1 Tax=Chromera velia CCMP2878 TaxID=1169474 RepID=A0A0G4G785_9ALVE|mmetsp:Transcript_1030/g.2191  ORF Transcript_1030/g.2191 Transcript_1030/m.2191 type:complete len:265 (+) Transcript_1030:47-841(+)|eukprot:Cvel_4244.t1-p1 / transcript=Cvel_4244.t1 / gene=Cvel_4244 / organism=Chromera_velia_CCMP2878 / gene_product=Superoxide dismutase [Mn], putative / transcript_product=Superoxide dismutase [Mn], putative / location=Cvel_scaffold183:114557-116545(+) / protein_length=264 / sequence_SO=supercontig / SO=protein_coding / is_pseudo=false
MFSGLSVVAAMSSFLVRSHAKVALGFLSAPRLRLTPFRTSGRSFATEASAFSLPELPYAYDALEPYIDKETMGFHHKNHHNTYVTKLNDAVKSRPDLASMKLADLQKVAFKEGGAVRNHGGGHYNHALFWTVMAPHAQQGQPSAALSDAITSSFGSMEAMQEQFATKAAGLFGSGFCWLTYNPASSKLQIVTTANQDNPLMEGLLPDKQIPIMGLDVWEHAYYLKYQSRRPEYIKAFWNVVNWSEVSKNFEQYAKAGAPVPVSG